MVRATFDALKSEDSPRGVAARRGIKVSTLQARRRDVDVETVGSLSRRQGAGHMAKKSAGKTLIVEQVAARAGAPPTSARP